MNTETNGALIQLTFIDALSFFEALAEKVGHGYGVESVVYKHGFHILMEYSREAYDENGYHVGTEIATFQWPLFPKRLMGISNVAYNLSEFVVLREQYICKGVKHPRVPRVTKYYFPADCDFYYSEMDFFLENEDQLSKYFAENVKVSSDKTQIKF